MSCKVCGGKTEGASSFWCATCLVGWQKSPEFARYMAAPLEQDSEAWDRCAADFTTRIRAERENGGRAVAKEGTP